MAASINDKLRKYKSLFSTTLSTGIGTGTSDTITPATVTGLPTDTAITLTIDRVDSSGIATPSKLERIKGIISGGNLIDYVRGVDGTTEQSHTAGAVVEMVWNAADLNDIVDWGLVEHSQLGVHDKTKVVDLTTAQTLTNKTLTAPTISTINTGAWTAFTPDWVNVTEGSATNEGAYCQIGKTVLFRAKITFAADTSVSGNIGLTLPVTIKSGVFENIGQAHFSNPGTGNFEGRITSGGTLMCLNAAGTYLIRTPVTATVPFTWAVDDYITVTGFYEAA